MVHRAPGRTGRRLSTFTIHECVVVDFVVVDGLLSVGAVTAVLGTLTTAGAITGQAVVDAALRSGVVDQASLIAGLRVWRRVPGVSRARRAIEQADPSAESIAESGLRPILTALGYRVLTQVRILDENGTVVARVDFLLPDLGVIVEFDGAIKYSGLQGQSALMAEKHREDRLRSLGYGVARVVWAQLYTPEQVKLLVERAARTVSPRLRQRTA